METIAVIEDNELTGDMITEILMKEGFRVLRAYSGTEALYLLQQNKPDLILLDLILPGLDGEGVLEHIKDIPVIVLSSKAEVEDKINLLNEGACDYITKPFSPSELVARVTAHISRYERLTSKGEEPVNYIINVGKLSIDTHARRVFVNEKEVTLTNKEFDLLTFLASNPNVVYSKDAIFDKIWGLDAIGETSTVTVHINRIRDKIETDSSNPQYIETVWGAGYRFKA